MLRSETVKQLPAAASFGSEAPCGRSGDTQLIELWISLKLSRHTRRAYASEAARFLTFLQRPLGAASLKDLQAFTQYIGQGSLRPSSQNRALTAIKSLLAFGHQTGYLPFDVGAAVRLQPVRDGLAQRILEESQVAKLIEAASEGRNRVLLKLLYASGVRVSELCALHWSDAAARIEGGQITVFGKGGKTRTILLKRKVWEQLSSLKGNARPADPVFRSRKGGRELDPSQVRRIVYQAATKAGLAEKVSPHWMRHAHASHSLDRRAPVHLVQATLGHASVATTGRYLHARPTESSSLYLPD